MARSWKYYKKLNARKQMQERQRDRGRDRGRDRDHENVRPVTRPCAESTNGIIFVHKDEGKALMDEMLRQDLYYRDATLLHGELGVFTTFSLKRSLDLTLATR